MGRHNKAKMELKAQKAKAREEEEAKAREEHLINETVKEFGWDNEANVEAMRTKETPNGWAQFVEREDALKSVEASSTVRLQPSQMYPTMGRHNKAQKAKAREEEEAKTKAEHLINETVKESGWDNEANVEAMRTKETPNGWAQFLAVRDPSTQFLAAEFSASNFPSYFHMNPTSIEAKFNALEFAQASVDERPQETVPVYANPNSYCLITETEKESGWDNEANAEKAMKTEEAASVWAQLAKERDVPKFGEASSVFRSQPSELEARQKPRVESSNSAEYNASWGEFRTAGSERGGVRGGYGDQASPSRVNDFPRIDALRRVLSVVLSHRAVELGLNMRSDGYVSVEDLLNLFLRAYAGLPLSSHTVDDIKEAVKTDNKQQFGLREENGQLLIRANQGHSIQTIKSEDLLSPIYLPEVPAMDRKNKASECIAKGGEEREARAREGYGDQASASRVDNYTRINSLGRLLSSVLRHRAVDLGLDMRSDGYVLVQDLLNLRLKTYAGLPLSSHTVDDIKQAVRTDNKQRFGLREQNGQLLIRANQGHSIQTIKSEDLLSRVYSPEEVPVCVHGTYLKYLDAIQKEGLKRLTRLHIHFAPGLFKEKGVISGMESSCEVLIHLNVQKYLKDGMKLYRSCNGVILAEGKNGVIPPDYFAKVERVRS